MHCDLEKVAHPPEREADIGDANNQLEEDERRQTHKKASRKTNDGCGQQGPNDQEDRGARVSQGITDVQRVGVRGKSEFASVYRG